VTGFRYKFVGAIYVSQVLMGQIDDILARNIWHKNTLIEQEPKGRASIFVEYWTASRLPGDSLYSYNPP